MLFLSRVTRATLSTCQLAIILSKLEIQLVWQLAILKTIFKNEYLILICSLDYVQGCTQQISKGAGGSIKTSILHSGADPENFGREDEILN